MLVPFRLLPIVFRIASHRLDCMILVACGLDGL